jgi:hypothetical protein
LRNELAERIVWIFFNAIEGGGGIDVPESDAGVCVLQFEDGGFEFGIENADATGFDDEVGALGGADDVVDVAIGGGVIDDDFGPIGIFDVAMFLAVVGVGFVKGDAMSPTMEGFDDAAIIGGGAVPIRGDEAGTEKGDVEVGGFHWFCNSS